MRQCLHALPSLRALGIMEDGPIVTEELRNLFRSKPDIDNIRKATIPVCARPILGRLPNLEELVCYHGTKDIIIKSFLSGVRVKYVDKGMGESDPVLKSISIIGPLGDGFVKGMDLLHHPGLGFEADPMHSYSPRRKIRKDSQGLPATRRFPFSRHRPPPLLRIRPCLA